MAGTKKPSEEPTVTVPGANDIVLIDGPLGTRALAVSYFTTTFAPLSAVKPLLAGSGITLVEGPSGITISSP